MMIALAVSLVLNWFLFGFAMDCNKRFKRAQEGAQKACRERWDTHLMLVQTIQERNELIDRLDRLRGGNAA